MATFTFLGYELFFSLNLALCETIFFLCSLFFIITYKLSEFSRLTFFTTALPTAGRPLITCVICIERYLQCSILFLFWNTNHWDTRFLSLVCSVYLLCPITCTYSFVFTCLCTRSFSPLNCSVFLAILKALRDPRPGEKSKAREKAFLRKRKAITLILLITATMFFQYTPLFLVGTLYTILSVAEFDLVWCIAVVILFMLPYVSPVLYIYKVGNLWLVFWNSIHLLI